MEPGGSEEQMNSSGDVFIQNWDIGKLIYSNVKLNDLSREEVYGILTCEPPMAKSVYPRMCQSESGSFHQFQPSWVKQFSWLHYSKFEDSTFCRACAIFAPSSIRGQALG